jgi:hypothetical protein
MQAPICSGLRVNFDKPELAYSLLVNVMIGFEWSVHFRIIN